MSGPLTGAVTARAAGLLACPACRLVCRGDDTIAAYCPRCDTRLFARKPASLARTWAFLIAAVILYVPANLLPIMASNSLFGSQVDTIASGVAFLWTSGSWGLATVVFVASIVVPLTKMLALAVLAASAQARARWHPRTRTRLYRLIDGIGRWSMLDIYVVTLLVALVQLSSIASVHAGPGAAAFGAVVVLTMLAAESFDPRLIWDPLGDTHH